MLQDFIGFYMILYDFIRCLQMFVGLLFEGVWACPTTVIRAADQREVGNVVRNRAPKTPDAPNFAEMLRFPTRELKTVGQYKVFH